MNVLENYINLWLYTIKQKSKWCVYQDHDTNSKISGRQYTWGDHGMEAKWRTKPQKSFKVLLEHTSLLGHLKYAISRLWGRGDQTTQIAPCQETVLQSLCCSCLCGWHTSGLLVSKEVIGPSEASHDFLALWESGVPEEATSSLFPDLLRGKTSE